MKIRDVCHGLKYDLARVAEERHQWEETDTHQTYDAKKALLRDVSPNHHAALMHYTEKYALHLIASHLAPGGLAVEIGSFLGGSASIMAHANPKVSIIGIDAYDEKLHVPDQQEMIDKAYGSGKQRTVENARKFVNQSYSNVTLIKARSPDECLDIDIADNQLDLLLEDAVHVDPGLGKNLDFWFPKVKSGGVILMHDYRPWLPQPLSKPPIRFHDVERHVHTLVKEKKAEMICLVRGLAILKKL